jgi:hypothetical protein
MKATRTEAESLLAIESFVKESRSKGHSFELIAIFLKNKGYPEPQIQQVLSQLGPTK